MSISNELNKLISTKTAIKNAIISKGETVSNNDLFSSYAGKIENITELKGETKTITPTTSQQTISPSSGKNGITQVTVNAVTSAIDNNITAGNIKNGVSILGVTGNYSGTSPSGTLSITSNGVYDVTNYASANVSVNTIVSSIGITRIVSNGVYKMPTESFTFTLPSEVQDLANYALYYAFHKCTGLTSVNLSSLINVSGDNALRHTFNGCTNLLNADLSSIVSITGFSALDNAFFNCSQLTSLDLSSLRTVNSIGGLRYMCGSCSNLTSVNLSSLNNIDGISVLQGAFSDCTSLLSLSFPSLKSTSFGVYHGQFQSMLSGVTGCTVHFPSNLQSVIGSWTDVQNGFDGTNTTVLFDLTATT